MVPDTRRGFDGDPPVRPARPPDWPAVRALQSELPSGSDAVLDAAFSGVGVVLVTPEDGRPAGYLLAVPGPDVVHVAEVVVAPERRREGRATALIESLADRFDRPLRLAVAPDNAPARRCYDSLGFEVAGRDPDYFDGDPALLLVRRN